MLPESSVGYLISTIISEHLIADLYGLFIAFALIARVSQYEIHQVIYI